MSGQERSAGLVRSGTVNVQCGAPPFQCEQPTKSGLPGRNGLIEYSIKLSPTTETPTTNGAIDSQAGTIVIVSRGDIRTNGCHDMTRQHESHVSEWASLLGERVADEAPELRRDESADRRRSDRLGERLSRDPDGPAPPSGR